MSLALAGTGNFTLTNAGNSIATLSGSAGSLSLTDSVAVTVSGSNLTTSVPMDGRLILAVNDDNYNDNSGSFSVRIRY